MFQLVSATEAFFLLRPSFMNLLEAELEIICVKYHVSCMENSYSVFVLDRKKKKVPIYASNFCKYNSGFKKKSWGI